MDDPVKNKTRKRRGTPAVPAQPLETGKTTASVADGHGGDAPDAAANQSHDQAAAKAPAHESHSPAAGDPADKNEPEPTSKAARPRLVRDSFALPKADHALLADLKNACQQEGIAVKKSQLLRVAVGLLRGLDAASLAQMVASLPATKPAVRRKGK
jgi:hypothetical protein